MVCSKKSRSGRARGAAAGLTAALLLTSCGLAQDNAESGGDGAEGGGGEVTFWHAFTAGAERGAIAEIIETYNAQNEDSPVRDRGIGNEEHFTVVRTGLAGNSPPDLVHYEGYQQTRDFAEAGQLVDLTDLWEEHQDKFLLDESAERACTYDGAVYCIPYTFHSGWQIYYNAPLLEEHGVSEPETWEDFMAASAQLDEAGVTPIAIGARDGWPAMHWWMAFVVQRCGVAHVYDVVEDEGASFTDECFVQASEDLANLAESGYFSDGAAGDDYGAAISLFRSEQAAFFQTGSWFAGELEADPAEFEVGIMRFPRFADAEYPDDITGAVTHVFGISSKANNEDGARRFLEYLISEEATTTWASAGLPSLVEGAVEEHAPEDIQTIFEGVLEADAALPWLENELPPGVGEDALYNGTTALVAGRMEPEEFVTSVQTALEEAR